MCFLKSFLQGTHFRIKFWKKSLGLLFNRIKMQWINLTQKNGFKIPKFQQKYELEFRFRSLILFSSEQKLKWCFWFAIGDWLKIDKKSSFSFKPKIPICYYSNRRLQLLTLFWKFIVNTWIWIFSKIRKYIVWTPIRYFLVKGEKSEVRSYFKTVKN